MGLSELLLTNLELLKDVSEDSLGGSVLKIEALLDGLLVFIPSLLFIMLTTLSGDFIALFLGGVTGSLADEL